MKTTIAILLVLCAVAAQRSEAQVSYILDSFSSGTAAATYMPSTTYPTGAPGTLPVIPLPSTSGLIAGGLEGGIAIDQATSRVFSSDGFTITTDDHSLYWPFVGVAAPVLPAPAPALLSGGPITGMGADSTAGLLWMTDGVSYGGYTLGAPFANVVPPMLFPFPLPAGLRMMGIDYDDADGTLWAVDIAGNVYHWVPGGAAIGPQPVATVGTPVGLPFVGLAVNDSNGAGALPPHFCSTQLLGYHIVITDGLQVYDALSSANPPLPANVNGAARGMTYSNDMQYTPGAGVAPIAVGRPGWNKPQNNGVGPINSLRLVAAQPLTSALFLYDNCHITGGLLIPLSGETLWINPLSPTFNFAPFVTDAAGEIDAPISLTFALTGFNLCGQWALYSPTSPLGYALTDMIRFVVGTP